MSTEDQEATLLLEIACARWEVCRAQKLLAECLNRENKSLCELHQFKAKKFADLVDDADLSIDVNISTSSGSQDEDGTTFEYVAGRLVAVKLD
ncbi:hypothetical protein SCLCIDRAFT_30620 [Scleroderma citrinum Foug A]|uniref:Uncharacterized protein n=1 Tax=Scleroderma citrinum Foug A TaxID=1036808 RepID=A0A0C3DFG9_9AGAM|nr:hypothetical protein SCLCIDRAFT_30620 [Scleroderma citrinum Foug A]